MVEQAAIRIGLQLGAQGRPGFRSAKGRARAWSVGFGRQALARPPLGEPTFQSGERHAEKPHDFGLQQAGFVGCHGPLAQVQGIGLGHRPLKHSSLDLQTGVTFTTAAFDHSSLGRFEASP
jgi:hypothetical protein